jgi:seryl-tRNA synthetase
MADPKIKYDIEANVRGDAEVSQLATRLEDLAKTLDGDLKTNANAAATALRQLGDKQTAVARFVELKQGAKDAADQLAQAQAAAQKLGRELATSEAPTRAQTGQMAKLSDAVRAAKAEVVAQNAAVIQARAGLQQYGVSTANLAQTQAHP